jgi:hypothetical protein
MNAFAELWGAIRSASITLPLAEVVVLMGILTFCLLYSFPKAGLIAAYLFLYRWGWGSFSHLGPKFTVAYTVFGSFAAILAVLGMMKQRAPP